MQEPDQGIPEVEVLAPRTSSRNPVLACMEAGQGQGPTVDLVPDTVDINYTCSTAKCVHTYQYVCMYICMYTIAPGVDCALPVHYAYT